MLIISYNKIKNNLKENAEKLANQIGKTSKDTSITIFSEKSDAFKVFIDEAITKKYSGDDTQYTEANPYSDKTGESKYISKETLSVEIHKTYLSVCNEFCRISFNDFDMSSFKSKKYMYVLRDLLCEELENIFDSEIKSYVCEKYNGIAANEINFKTICIPHVKYAYKKVKIPSIDIAFAFSAPVESVKKVHSGIGAE